MTDERLEAGGQLDLFLDSQAVRLENEVIDALAARDPARAGASIGELRRAAPDSANVPAFEALARALAG